MIGDGGLDCPPPAFGEDPRKLAAAQIQSANLSLPEVWAHYFGIGGNADEEALDAYLNGMMDLAPLQVDLLNIAIREITADGP
ncbi:MAG: hypothetical protein JWQ75_3304 [Pseudarthrobacter sp.]|nr:hypothetical protein [Pseudarthrobacter sp.]